MNQKDYKNVIRIIDYVWQYRRQTTDKIIFQKRLKESIKEELKRVFLKDWGLKNEIL